MPRAEKATPNRNTVVEFGAIASPVIQPYFGMDRTARDINASDSEQVENVIYIDGLGYTLKGHQINLAQLWEGQNQGTPLLGTYPTEVIEQNFFSQDSLTGVIYSGSPAAGMPMRQKQVASTGSWDIKLDADQTAYPGPSTAAIADLDRLFVSTALHEPDSGLNFQFILPSSGLALHGPVAAIGFSGPAGTDDDLEGFGQYFLVCSGTGQADLYERGTKDGSTTWAKRFSFPYCQVAAATLQSISILSDATEMCSNGWKGTTLAFHTMNASAMGKGFKLIEALIATAQTAVARHFHTFRVPGAGQTATQLTQARIDIRRDVRALFSASEMTFPEEGVILDAPFSMPSVVTDAEPVTMQWFGDRPSGTDIAVQLYCGTNDGTGAAWTEMTRTVVSENCKGQHLSFAFPTGFIGRHFQVKITLTSDGGKRPTFANYHVERAAVTAEAVVTDMEFPVRAAGVAVPAASVSGVSITGIGEDPTMETANLELSDMLGVNPSGRYRTGRPLDVVVKDDAGDVVSYLHRGIIQSVTSKKLARRGADYPSDDSYVAQIVTKGEWQRIERCYVPKQMVFFDPAVGLPWVVTTAVKYVLQTYCGYQASQLDIPSLPIRFLGEDVKLESGSEVSQVLTRWLSDYLAAYLVFDRNAGTDGMWRLIARKSPPYDDILLRFTPDHPGSGKISTRIGAYGSTTAGSGQVIQHLPMFELEERWERPEANIVAVYGGSPSKSKSANVTEVRAESDAEAPITQLSQVAVNVESVNLFGLDPAHAFYPDTDSPDYLGEPWTVEVRDPALSTQAAVDWVCRRIYDATVYARHYKTFRTYLPFITVQGDSYQATPRPPQFYDMVEVWEGGDWVPYVISAPPKFEYKKSGHMTMQVELMTSTGVQNYAAIPRSALGPYQWWSAVAKKIIGDTGLRGYRKPVASAGRKLTLSPAAMSTLPESVAKPIQDLDPSSPTFGQFYTMAGYDPAP